MKLKPIAFLIMAPLAFNAYANQFNSGSPATSAQASNLQQSPAASSLPLPPRDSWLELDRVLYNENDFRRLKSDYEKMEDHYKKLKESQKKALGNESALREIEKKKRNALKEADLYRTVVHIGESAKDAKMVARASSRQLSQYDSKMKEYKKTVNSKIKGFEENNKKIGNIDERFASNERDRNDIRSKTEENATNIGKVGLLATKTIETMDERNDIVDNKFKNAKADRDDIRGKTVENKQQITKIAKVATINESYMAQTDTNKGNIESLSHDFAIFDQRLDEQANLTEALQQQFKDFKSEFESEKKRTNAAIAGVTALSMLPQPYSAGRANIAAGVGHYHGETAMAIGLGYAVNENLTFRSGVSYTKNMKRPAIGAAVGYTF